MVSFPWGGWAAHLYPGSFPTKHPQNQHLSENPDTSANGVMEKPFTSNLGGLVLFPAPR